MHKLHFKKSEVAPLLEHTRHAPEHTAPYGIGEPVPGLFLVKDQGIYLMSNGKPHLPRPGGKPEWSQVAFAKGFDPSNPADAEDLWERTHHISGDDFGELLPLAMFEPAMQRPGQYLELRLTKTHITVY